VIEVGPVNVPPLDRLATNRHRERLPTLCTVVVIGWRKAISRAGVTQATVAKALGPSQPYVSDVTRCRHPTITVENARKVRSVLRSQH